MNPDAKSVEHAASCGTGTQIQGSKDCGTEGPGDGRWFLPVCGRGVSPQAAIFWARWWRWVLFMTLASRRRCSGGRRPQRRRGRGAFGWPGPHPLAGGGRRGGEQPRLGTGPKREERRLLARARPRRALQGARRPGRIVLIRDRGAPGRGHRVARDLARPGGRVGVHHDQPCGLNAFSKRGTASTHQSGVASQFTTLTASAKSRRLKGPSPTAEKIR